jgi:proteasome lid subunit RPN8/RPN11
VDSGEAPRLPVRPMKRLILSRLQWGLMRAHVTAELPFEACGLLAGHDDTVHEVLPITNQLPSPTRFRMEPAEQLRAFAAIGDKAMSLLGIFHSHPGPPGLTAAPVPAPSETDIGEAAYPVVHVIWSRPTGPWEAHGYWIEDKRVSDVALAIMEMKSQ